MVLLWPFPAPDLGLRVTGTVLSPRSPAPPLPPMQESQPSLWGAKPLECGTLTPGSECPGWTWPGKQERLRGGVACPLALGWDGGKGSAGQRCLPT